MALPRYNDNSVPLQQVSPIGYQAQSQVMSTLSDRLSQWQDTAFERAKVEVTEEGRNQAIKDMTSGDPLRIEKGYGFYAKAYNDVSKAAFNANVEADFQAKAEELSTTATSKEEFDTVFKSYYETSTGKIAEPEFKALSQLAALKYKGHYGSKVAQRVYKQKLDADIKAISTGLEQAKQEYSILNASPDTPDREVFLADNLAKQQALYERLVEHGQLSPEGVRYEMVKTVKEANIVYHQTQLSQFVQEGRGHEYLKTINNDTTLLPKEKEDLKKNLYEAMNNQHNVITTEAKNKVEFINAVSSGNKTALEMKMLKGQDISKDIEELSRAGELNLDDALKLEELSLGYKNGALVSDPSAVLYWESRVEFANPSDVIRDSRLSVRDKRQLVSRVINHQETVKGNQALADAFKNQKQIFGKDSWQMAYEKVSAEFSKADYGDEYKRKQVDLINTLRSEVSSGQLDPLNVHTRAGQLAKEIKASEKADQDEKKRVKKERMEKIKTKIIEEKKSDSTLHKLGNTLGVDYVPSVSDDEVKKRYDSVYKGK